MGNAAGIAVGGPIRLGLDQPGCVLKVDAGSSQTIHFPITDKDRRMLLQQEDAGYYASIEIALHINRGNIRYFYFGKRSPKLTENSRLFKSVAVQQTEVRMQILAKDTNNFKSGDYSVTIEGGTELCLLQAAVYTVSDQPEVQKSIIKDLRMKLSESEFHLSRIMKQRDELRDELEEQRQYILILRKKLNLTNERAENHRAARLKAILANWRMKTGAPVFQAWKNWAKQQRAKKKMLMDKVVKRLQYGKLYIAWKQWKDHVHGDKTAKLQALLKAQKEKRAAVIIQNWRNKAVIPAFNAWRTWAHTQRERRVYLMSKVVRRLQFGALDVAWKSWLIYTKKARMMAKVVKRLQYGKLHVAWSLWKSRVAEKNTKQALLATENEAKRQARKQALMDKIVTRMGKAPLWRAWRLWTKMVESKKTMELKRKMDNKKKQRVILFVKRWRMGAVARMFRAWKDFTKQNHGKKTKLLNKVLLRLGSSAKWRAWRQWRSYVESQRNMTLRAQIEAEVKAKYGLNSAVLKKTLAEMGMQPKYEDLVMKYKRLQYLYDALLKYIFKFRSQLTVFLALENDRNAHNCSCQVCSMRRQSKATEGNLGWLVKFDADIRHYRLLK